MPGSLASAASFGILISSHPMSAFTGLSAFPITPCDAAGRLDEEGLRRLLAPLVEVATRCKDESEGARAFQCRELELVSSL